MNGIRRLKLACFSDKGTVRDNNEDNMYSSLYSIVNENTEDYCCATFLDEYKTDLSVFTVFDGMGGTEGGGIAALVAANQMPHLVERLKGNGLLPDEELSCLLFDIKLQIENETRITLEVSRVEQPGTTCCGFMMCNGIVRPFWIGDSRLYLLRRNKLILLTKDHTIAQEKIDYGLITPEEAVAANSWHYITAYIGDNHNNFTIGKGFEVEPGDKYLLCTDGISDKFSIDELAEYMNEGTSSFIDIVTAEVKKQSKDNATAMIVELIPDT